MLGLRLSPEQFEAAEAFRKSEANQLRSMGYRETETLFPVVWVQRALRSLPCIDFDCSAPAIPTVQVLDDSCSAGQVSNANQARNPVAVDPSGLPSVAYFCLPKTIALNIRFVLHSLSGRRRNHDFQYDFEVLLAQRSTLF